MADRMHVKTRISTIVLKNGISFVLYTNLAKYHWGCGVWEAVLRVPLATRWHFMVCH